MGQRQGGRFQHKMPEEDQPGQKAKGMRSGQPSQPQPAAPKIEYIAEHTVASGETLSHIALKHYGSAAKEKWMLIFEANKEVIGDNPNLIRPGQVLKIPKQPE